MGHGSILKIQNILNFHQPHKIFLVTGKKSYPLSGAKKALEPILSQNSPIRFSDFSPNPKLEDIQKGMELMADSGADMIIAIGGGSALDAAKAMNILSAQDGEPINYVKGKRKIKRCILCQKDTKQIEKRDSEHRDTKKEVKGERDDMVRTGFLRIQNGRGS